MENLEVFGDAAAIHENGVVEVFDPVAYLRTIGVDVRIGMAGDVYVTPTAADTVAECGACGRMWDDAVPTAWTPTPGGRCPFEYDHGDD